MGKSPRPAPASPSIKAWTPYDIGGFYRRRRWRPNWRFFMWCAINVLAWIAVIFGLAWWL